MVDLSKKKHGYLLQSDDVMRSEKLAFRKLSLLNGASAWRVGLKDCLAGKISLEQIEATPIATVEFINAMLRVYGLSPLKDISYPGCLQPFLGREVWISAFEEVDDGYFVKPVDCVKEFTGHIKGKWPAHEEAKDLEGVAVWVSERIDLTAEWRFYINQERIVGHARYDEYDTELPLPNLGLVKEAVRTFSGAYNSPSAYSLDFGLTSKGDYVLIEVNDAVSLGFYTGQDSHIEAKDYIEMLDVRWAELLRQKTDEIGNCTK